MKPLLTLTLVGLCAQVSLATSVFTEFNRSDGFVTGSLAPATLSDADGMPQVVFSGGAQQQSFFGAAYNSGPAAFLFNTDGVRGITPTGNSGFIGILGGGATEISFHAASLTGDQTSFTAFGIDGSVLGSVFAEANSLNGDSPLEIIEFSAIDGNNIAGIQVDLFGAASSASIDTFSATVAVPEPSAAILGSLFLLSTCLRRRR